MDYQRFVPCVGIFRLLDLWYNGRDFDCLPKEATMPDWISVRKAANYTGYSTGHLRHLLINGFLEGQKFGRDWFTTKEALDKYLATNPRPGPKKR